MSGVSIDLSHPRHCSGRKTLRRRFSDIDDADDLILIDVDSEMSDNVIIIDVPESLPRKNKGSSRLRKDDDWSFKNVIYIDDDDDDDNDETPEPHSPIREENRHSTFGATSSRQSYPDAKKCACSLKKECQYVPENVKPVRISKCKRTYSGKGPASNRYGLDIDSESESSDSDSEDCEIIDDSSGKVQEQWEKAFSRRANIHRGHSNTRDHDDTSGAINEDHPNNLHYNMSDTIGKAGNQVNSSPSIFEVYEDPIEFGQGSFSDHIFERRDKPSSSKSACEEQLAENFDHPIPEFHETAPEVEPCPSTSELHIDSSHNEHTLNEPAIRRCQNIKDAPCMFFPTEDTYFEEENRTDNVKESEILEQERPKANGVEKEMDNSASELPLSERKHIFSKNISVLRDDMNNGCRQESSSMSSKITLSGNVLVDEANLLREDNEDRLQLCSPNDLSLSSIESSVISEREKLKETDEYKKALEEEWASRRQVLQIQAEEAQRQRRLLKRRKAEKWRLLDMERRQKQRVEEVRNTLKKDEDNMNLKVEIQTKVREKLKNLEVQCHNMATLLYLLGINIAGWPNPSPQAVQAAYKRALLTFHPDRASQSDLPRQVEAEETFKLINCLKEKFSSF